MQDKAHKGGLIREGVIKGGLLESGFNEMANAESLLPLPSYRANFLSSPVLSDWDKYQQFLLVHQHVQLCNHPKQEFASDDGFADSKMQLQGKDNYSINKLLKHL